MAKLIYKGSSKDNTKVTISRTGNRTWTFKVSLEIAKLHQVQKLQHSNVSNVRKFLSRANLPHEIKIPFHGKSGL